MLQEHDQHALYSGTNLLGLGYKKLPLLDCCCVSWTS